MTAKIINFFYRVFTIIFTLIFIISGMTIIEIYKSDKYDSETISEIKEFNPIKNDDTSSIYDINLKSESFLNLQNLNPDAKGWITINDTKIDYPFVQSEDNIKYLERTVTGEESRAGSIFLDFRSTEDMSSLYTILYGHNMKNGSMFSAVHDFVDESFRNEHTTGFIYIPDALYDLHIFSFLIIPADDPVIYDPYIGTENGHSIDEFLSYVKKKAVFYKNISLQENDRIIALSTCSYEYEDARSVILAYAVLSDKNN